MKFPAEPESKKASAGKETLAAKEICTGTIKRGEEDFTPSDASPTFTRCEGFPDAVDELDSPLRSVRNSHSISINSRSSGETFLAGSGEPDPLSWPPRRKAQQPAAMVAGREVPGVDNACCEQDSFLGEVPGVFQ